MTAPLEGRVALVTGGGRGIGRAIALALAADGADVAVNYRRDADAAAKTVTDIESLGRRARSYAASIDSVDDDRAMVDAAIADFGFVDILVNNAGIASRGKSVMRTEPEELEHVIRTHAFGPHHLSQGVLPAMRDRERGDIVMISLVTTLDMPAGGAPYSMGKAAVEALALTLAKEELRNNIRVNIVAPGLVDTTMGEKLMKAAAGIEDLRVLDEAMPFGHVCSPDDVANVVRWLVGPGNTYVTGQKINVDDLVTFMRR
jgi:NAD(P)-dependent dehydrogenase (short-subunit alcohol dehydrogenase family)